MINVLIEDLKYKSKFGNNYGIYQDGYRIVYFYFNYWSVKILISTVKAIYNHIEKAEIISKELTEILLEMDTTNSRVTQASLNDILVSLYNRIKVDKEDTFESTNNKLDCRAFIDWVDNNFTVYSANMLKDTLNIK